MGKVNYMNVEREINGFSLTMTVKVLLDYIAAHWWKHNVSCGQTPTGPHLSQKGNSFITLIKASFSNYYPQRAGSIQKQEHRGRLSDPSPVFNDRDNRGRGFLHVAADMFLLREWYIWVGWWYVLVRLRFALAISRQLCWPPHPVRLVLRDVIVFSDALAYQLLCAVVECVFPETTDMRALCLLYIVWPLFCIIFLAQNRVQLFNKWINQSNKKSMLIILTLLWCDIIVNN